MRIGNLTVPIVLIAGLALVGCGETDSQQSLPTGAKDKQVTIKVPGMF